ncbi:MAG: UDP-N-acetylmuramoyl-L-alanyl-D-glutamate--2,6-diaminopimelate ligase [Clostridiales bacterium]|jgi:UDP-N-acetylmuramoyl-L-alanyl-D-glutamate--2,6-diaminopimelate ligase|nr:UDP-N-acetylmuramoyl-L-alanyl-D-glutamate--2,6-diaminopimelate ligase [Clostridiales bacterium]
MYLSEVLTGVEVKERIGDDVIIKSLSCDSQKIGVAGLYFCITGTRADGHDYAAAAIANGAAAIITQRRLPVDIPQAVVADARAEMARISANFYGNPIDKMKLIAVTGTNGKTTTTFIIRSIGEVAGRKVGLIGTTAIYIGGERLPAELTTPDPITLHGVFRRMLDAGCEWVVMEVSAHAIELRKMAGVVADVAVFTNLTQDHLDFFGTIERYRQTKVSYFSSLYAAAAVVNADDPTGRLILNTADIPCYTYGLNNPSDVFAVDYESDVKGQKYVINLLDNLYDIKFRLPGRFNLYNTLAAAAAAYLLGVELGDIAGGIGALKLVPGRYNMLDTEPYQVIIDYAHTPDGLQKVLTSIREYAKGKIITVFGCGGNRDRSKRALMGAAAGALSDYGIITSDNPRCEDPDMIISEIEEGFKQSSRPYACIENRRQAISHALKMAAAGDIILISGKGDEPYQEISGVKYPYNDTDTVYELLGKRGG